MATSSLGQREIPAMAQLDGNLTKHWASHEGWIESAQERCLVRSTFEQLKDFKSSVSQPPSLKLPAACA